MDVSTAMDVSTGSECRNITNGHDLIDTSHKDLGNWIYKYLFLILVPFIILSNLLVVISSGLILKKGQKPKTAYMFLRNLAAADLLTGVAILFARLTSSEYQGHSVCIINMAMMITGPLTSVYGIGLIGIERYVYIIHGMHYKRLMYPRRATYLICISWFIGILIGFTPLMFWHGRTNEGRCCWLLVVVPKWLLLVIMLAAAAPLTVVVFLYSIILYHALKKITKIQQAVFGGNNYDSEDISAGNIRMFIGGWQQDNRSREQDSEQCERIGASRVLKRKSPILGKSNAIRVAMITTGSFVITLTPLFTASVLYAVYCDTGFDSKMCKVLTLLITNILSAFGMLYPILNPIIHAWCHNDFRKFVKKKIVSLIRRREY